MLRNLKCVFWTGSAHGTERAKPRVPAAFPEFINSTLSALSRFYVLGNAIRNGTEGALISINVRMEGYNVESAYHS